MSEQWRPVTDFEGLYEVSDRGRVRSLPRQGASGGIRKAVLNRRGRPVMLLYKANQSTMLHVHTIVGRAFLGPLPPGMETRHLNSDPTDNRLVNLAYGTPAENHSDRKPLGVYPYDAPTICRSGRHSMTDAYEYGGRRRCRSCRDEARQRWRARNR